MLLDSKNSTETGIQIASGDDSNIKFATIIGSRTILCWHLLQNDRPISICSITSGEHIRHAAWNKACPPRKLMHPCTIWLPSSFVLQNTQKLLKSGTVMFPLGQSLHHIANCSFVSMFSWCFFTGQILGQILSQIN